MDVEVNILSAPNIFIPNEVFNIGRPQGRTAETISVARFMVAESPSGSLISVLNYIFSLIERKLFGYDIWFFVSSSAWQQDTRVVRYRKLWGALSFRGNEVVGGSELQERKVEKGTDLFVGLKKGTDLFVLPLNKSVPFFLALQ